MGKVAELHVGDDDLSKFRREAARDKAAVLTEYEYLDAAGDLEFIAVRQDFTDDRKKRFRPFSPDGTSGYPKGDKDRSRPLYNLPKVVSKPSGGVKVIVVEGEKCVAAAEGVFPEAVVVTWVGGGNAIDKTDWKPLDVSVVLLLTDTDEPGRLAMRKIAGKLKRLACTVLQYAREGDDRSDIFEWSQGLDAAGLRDLREEIEAGACDPKHAGQPVAETVGQSLDFETVEPWPEGKVEWRGGACGASRDCPHSHAHGRLPGGCGRSMGCPRLAARSPGYRACPLPQHHRPGHAVGQDDAPGDRGAVCSASASASRREPRFPVPRD